MRYRILRILKKGILWVGKKLTASRTASAKARSSEGGQKLCRGKSTEQNTIVSQKKTSSIAWETYWLAGVRFMKTKD